MTITAQEFYAFLQVVWIDLALAGDNAIVVGMAAAGLPREQRSKAIAIGIGAAVVMRIGFALITTELLQIVGLLFAGGLLLLWVSWKLWREIAAQRAEAREAAGAAALEALAATPGEVKPLRAAVVQIIVADLSMSLDNVLAVAGAAREHAWVLIFGLALSIVLMALAANLIARLLQRHHWIAYLGLAVILYVAGTMIYEGALEVMAATG